MSPYVVAGLLVVFGLWWFTQSRCLFRLSVRSGRVLVVRGRIPPGMLADMREVLSTVRRGGIQAVAGERGGRLTTSGDIDSGTEQRLRNIFSLYPIARLRNAPAIAKPTLGQVLGITWLAWVLDRSFK